MATLSLNDLKDFRGKTVFVRVDYNVPLDDAGQITDDKRIKATVPTLDYQIKGGAKVVLASHLGRPKGQVVDGLRMAPVAARLSELLGRPVRRAEDAELSALGVAHMAGIGAGVWSAEACRTLPRRHRPFPRLRRSRRPASPPGGRGGSGLTRTASRSCGRTPPRTSA